MAVTLTCLNFMHGIGEMIGQVVICSKMGNFIIEIEVGRFSHKVAKLTTLTGCLRNEFWGDLNIII